MHTLADSSYMITYRLDENTTIEIETRNVNFIDFDLRGRWRSYNNIGFARVSHLMSESLGHHVCFTRRLAAYEFEYEYLQTFRLCAH